MGKEKGKKRGGIDFKAAQELLNERQKERSMSGGGGTLGDVRWLRPPISGEIKVRFLPPCEGEPVPGMLVHKHYNLPEHEELKGNITCFKTWGMECPICEVLKEYQNKAKLDEFFGTSAYFNVLVIDNEDYDPKLPYLLQISPYTYDWLLQQVVNADVGDITDVEAGANVTFRRKKKKGAFDRIISRRSNPIADTQEEIDEILDNMYDMKKIWREGDDSYYNIAVDLAEQLREIVEDRLLRLGNRDEDRNKPVREVVDAKRRFGRDSQEEDEEEKPSRSRRRTASSEDEVEESEEKPSRGRRRTVSQEEEEGERPSRGRRKASQEEEEEERPSRGRRRTVSREDEEEDEVNEDEIEEDEVEEEPEEKPSRGKSKGKRRTVSREEEEEEPEEKPKSKLSDKKVNLGKPPKAPDCFGKEHATNDRKCQICQFEYECEEASS